MDLLPSGVQIAPATATSAVLPTALAATRREVSGRWNVVNGNSERGKAPPSNCDLSDLKWSFEKK